MEFVSIDVVPVVAIIVTIAIGWWGCIYERSRRSNVRILRALDIYRENARKFISAGHQGLIQAGVANLKNDGEIRILISKIIHHGLPDPLDTKGDSYSKLDLHEFFLEVTKRGVDATDVLALDSLADELAN